MVSQPQADVPAKRQRWSVGQVAAAAGVSERTIHYYEECGLIAPAERTPGRHRRYDHDVTERLEHIRELREIMGYRLAEIRTILSDEDRWRELQAAWDTHPDPDEHRRLLDEAVVVLDARQQRLQTKIDRLQSIADRLRDESARCRALRDDLDPSQERGRTSATADQAPAHDRS